MGLELIQRRLRGARMARLPAPAARLPPFRAVSLPYPSRYRGELALASRQPTTSYISRRALLRSSSAVPLIFGRSVITGSHLI